MTDMIECFVCMDRGVFFLEMKNGQVNTWNPETGKNDGSLRDLMYEYVFSCSCKAGKEYPAFPGYTHIETLSEISTRNKKRYSRDFGSGEKKRTDTERVRR